MTITDAAPETAAVLEDPELRAIELIVSTLEELGDPEAVGRILRWAAARFGA